MRSLPRWCTAFVLMVGLASCHRAGEPIDPTSPEFPGGDEFVLAVGSSKVLAREGIEVGFEAVQGDSRCPKDLVCVVAGSAKVRLWARPLQSTDRERFDLVLPAGHEDSDQVSKVIAECRISLLSLEPYPVSTSPTPPDAYTAKLRVTFETD